MRLRWLVDVEEATRRLDYWRGVLLLLVVVLLLLRIMGIIRIGIRC